MYFRLFTSLFVFTLLFCTTACFKDSSLGDGGVFQTDNGDTNIIVNENGDIKYGQSEIPIVIDTTGQTNPEENLDDDGN